VLLSFVFVDHRYYEIWCGMLLTKGQGMKENFHERQTISRAITRQFWSVSKPYVDTKGKRKR